MDATELGIQLFFLILLPGFFSGVGFRFTSGLKGRGGDFASICYAAICGVLLVAFFGTDTEHFPKIIADPILGGVSLAFTGCVVGAVIGIPFGWIRSKMR